MNNRLYLHGNPSSSQRFHTSGVLLVSLCHCVHEIYSGFPDGHLLSDVPCTMACDQRSALHCRLSMAKVDK